MSKTPRLTVVIPCLNEGEYLENLLSSLTKQSFRDFEVIVSDADSTDDTVAIARSYQGSLSLSVITGAKRGVSNGRNAGAAHSRTDWLLFLDGDVRLSPDFLERLIAGAESRGFEVASGYPKADSQSRLDRFGGEVSFRYMRLFEHSKHPIACGYCILIKREVFERIGGFDPNIELAEDYELVNRVAATGAQFGFVLEAVLYVSVRRFEQGGRIRRFLIGAVYEAYRLTHNNRIDNGVFRYEFGQHSKSSKTDNST